MNKGRILVFSCHGGGGHVSAAAAVTSYLSNKYTVESIDAIGKLLVILDPLYYISFKKYSGQDLYNFLLSHNKKKIINFLCIIGTFLIAIQKQFIYRKFLTYLKKENPDLIISVIPLVNVMIKDAAHTLNIPFLIIPTDLDGTTFTSNITLHKDEPLLIGLGFDYPEVRSTLLEKQHEYNLKPIGFPIRESFFTTKDIQELKRLYQIPLHTPVLMLIMGATGSIAIIEYLKVLITIGFPLHIIICIGRNSTLKTRIAEFLFPPHITYTIIDNTIDISDIMAISDLCITKPGSCTFAECLYMELPMLIDNTSTFLNWERFNAFFLKKHNVGDVITSYNQAKDLVTAYFTNESWRNTIKNNIQSIQKKNFKYELPLLVERILAPNI